MKIKRAAELLGGLTLALIAIGLFSGFQTVAVIILSLLHFLSGVAQYLVTGGFLEVARYVLAILAGLFASLMLLGFFTDETLRDNPHGESSQKHE